eukprot:bmy_04166T0
MEAPQRLPATTSAPGWSRKLLLLPLLLFLLPAKALWGLEVEERPPTHEEECHFYACRQVYLISKDYSVYLEDSGHTLRGLFITDDKGILRQITLNDLPGSRFVDETLRLVQAFLYTDKHGEVCPGGWKPGGETMWNSSFLFIHHDIENIYPDVTEGLTILDEKPDMVNERWNERGRACGMSERQQTCAWGLTVKIDDLGLAKSERWDYVPPEVQEREQLRRGLGRELHMYLPESVVFQKSRAPGRSHRIQAQAPGEQYFCLDICHTNEIKADSYGGNCYHMVTLLEESTSLAIFSTDTKGVLLNIYKISLQEEHAISVSSIISFVIQLKKEPKLQSCFDQIIITSRLIKRSIAMLKGQLEIQSGKVFAASLSGDETIFEMDEILILGIHN